MADVEKNTKGPHISTFDIQDPAVSPPSSSFKDVPSTQAQRVRQNSVIREHGFLGRLRHYEAVLDKKLGIEGAGPERVLPEDRKPPRSWMMALVWASGTMNLSCFTTGFLGFELGLNLQDTLLCLIFGTFLGAMLTGWCATLGPKTGLRQVSISRYSMGWWPVKIIAVLNVIEQLGWSSVGCITGGLALAAVSNGAVGSELGVIICAIAGLVFSFFGLRAVLKYEEYAWAIFFIVFMVIYGEAGTQADITTPTELTGTVLSGTCLSLIAVVYGSSASWCSIVSDYYVHYHPDTSVHKVFWLTTLGISVPTCIGMCAGACVGSAFGLIPSWEDTYSNDGVGYLVQLILYPRGFAKFICVLLVLSGIGMNCIAIYSGALSIQQFARPLQRVPRFVWTLALFVGILLLGLVGRNHLLAFLQNFLSLLGYWNTTYFVIVFLEHYLFRKGRIENYDLDAWNDPKRLPIGYAGGLAFAMGIVGCVLGMAETWYVGVISIKFGPYGGDIGNQLAFVFTLVTYMPARYLELKYVGR